jgi:hypothetical protein
VSQSSPNALCSVIRFKGQQLVWQKTCCLQDLSVGRLISFMQETELLLQPFNLHVGGRG